MGLTGRKIKNSKCFWPDLQNFVSEKEHQIEKGLKAQSKYEAMLAAAQDEVSDFEKALLEVSSLYDDLLDKFKCLQIENVELKQKLSNYENKKVAESQMKNSQG